MMPSACSPQTPDVSIATGTTSTPEMMPAYLTTFRDSAAAAAEPAWTLLARKWDTANVSGYVASHRRLAQGNYYSNSTSNPATRNDKQLTIPYRNINAFLAFFPAG